MYPLSIIIPTKNEQDNIINLLDCLSIQTFQNFNIIISDNNSSDNTLNLIQKHNLYNRIIITKGGLPSVGRNNGAKLSNSKYLLFIDADIQIKDVHLIQKSILMMETKNLELLTTNIDCYVNNKIVKLIYKLNNIFQYLSKLDKPYSTGMYFLIKNETFKKLKGFNPDDQYAEDYNLSRKIPRKNFNIILNSKVYSNDRRFKKMGNFHIIKLFLKTLINKNNESYYKKDINYFK